MKKLGSFVNPTLWRRAHLLEHMTASARGRLPRHLARHCWVGGYDAACVILVTDDSTFTTPINYHQHEIVKQLNEDFGRELGRRFKKAKVRVSPASLFPTPENGRKPRDRVQ